MKNKVIIAKWSENYKGWFLYKYFMYEPSEKEAEKVLKDCQKESPNSKFKIIWNNDRIDWIET